MPCRATYDAQIMVENFDKMWSTGEGNGKPLQHSCLENPTNSIKRQKDMTLEDESTKSGVQHAPGEERRNSSRKKEEAGPKQKEHSAVDVSGGESKF